MVWLHVDSDEVSGSPEILVDVRDGGEIVTHKALRKMLPRPGLRAIRPKQ